MTVRSDVNSCVSFLLEAINLYFFFLFSGKMYSKQLEFPGQDSGLVQCFLIKENERT